MENKAVEKTRTAWPSMSQSGWMDKFFNAPIDEFFNMGRIINVPAANVSETDRAFTLSMAAPGLEKKDFKVEAYDDLLTISAQKEEKEEKNGRYNRKEYSYSSWSRSFNLPENCDLAKINATYLNGELKITIPKKETAAPHKIKSISVD